MTEIDNDIDDMQRVIENRCAECGVSSNSTKYIMCEYNSHHMKTCSMFDQYTPKPTSMLEDSYFD